MNEIKRDNEIDKPLLEFKLNQHLALFIMDLSIGFSVVFLINILFGNI